MEGNFSSLFVKLKGVENELFFETKTSSLARRFSFKKQFVFDPLLADLTGYFQHLLRHSLISSPYHQFIFENLSTSKTIF